MYPKYRPDIDGLRALAVLSVLAFHAFPEYVGGGFVGVDVFFVISGYLISSIILGGLREGAFSFKTFYARRIKRIFPALLIVLSACLAIGWLFFLPIDYRNLGKHVAAGAGFVSNLTLLNEHGYFDKASEVKPLLHLWSLGIEEQFYILWPIALYVGWKMKANLFRLTVAVLLGSFFANIGLVGGNQAAAFYLPFSRIWELLFGAALATLHLSPARAGHRDNDAWIRHGQSLAGAALILFAVFFLDAKARFPGWWALLPAAGASLLIAAGPAAFVNRAILSRPIAVGIGLISYPLYLWHWPLLSCTKIVLGPALSLPLRCLLLAASFLLAYLTYRFLEKPIRFSFSLKKATPVLSAAMGVVATGGLVCFENNGFPWRFNAQLEEYLTYQYDYERDARVGSCWLENDAPFDGYAASCVDAPQEGKPLLVVWGDSHAARFFPGLRDLVGENYRLAQFTRNSCPPMSEMGTESATCREANAYVLGRIGALRPAVVILFAVWNYHINPDQPGPALEAIGKTIAALKELGVPKIVLMGPPPQWSDTLPGNLLREALDTASGTIPTRTFLKSDPVVSRIDAILAEQFRSSPAAVYFSTRNALCDANGCLTTVDGRAQGLTTWDYGHFTTPGAAFVANKLLETIFDRPESPPLEIGRSPEGSERPAR